MNVQEPYLGILSHFASSSFTIMGAQQSVELREMLHHSTVDQLLVDDEVVNPLVAAVPSLSPRARENLQRLMPASENPSAETGPLSGPKLRPILHLKESDTALQAPLQHWLLRGQRNLPAGLGLDRLTFTNEDDVNAALFERYSNTLALERRRIVDRVCWRFCAMFFYDLHVLINGQDYLTSRGLEAIIHAIKTIHLSQQDKEEMRSNLKFWIGRGHRYRNLSNALGGSGCLFLLPEKISDYLWEDSLPLKGPAFEQAIAKLQSLGMERMAAKYSAHEMGANIESLLLPFRWHVTNQVQSLIPPFDLQNEDAQRSKRRRSYPKKKDTSSSDDSPRFSQYRDRDTSVLPLRSGVASRQLPGQMASSYAQQGLGYVPGLYSFASSPTESNSGTTEWWKNAEYVAQQQSYLAGQHGRGNVVMGSEFVDSAREAAIQDHQQGIVDNTSILGLNQIQAFEYEGMLPNDHTGEAGVDRGNLDIRQSNYSACC